MKSIDRYIIFIVLIYAFLVVFINPIGEFPLNDDWSYSKTAFELYNTGKMDSLGRSGTTLIFQIFWGELFFYIFGPSFTALRISTIILSLLGSVAFYLIMRELAFSKNLSFLSTLLFIFNPIYMNLTFTYMTDVPFLSFLLLGMFFYIRGINKNSRTLLLLGSVFSIMSFLIRQIALILPFSVFLYLFVRGGRKITFYNALINLVLPILVFIPVTYWYQFVALAPHDIVQLGVFDYNILLKNIFVVTFNTAIYSSFFILPFIFSHIKITKNVFEKNKLVFISIILLCASASLFYYLYRSHVMPFWGNILYDFGTGPPLLRSIFDFPPPAHLGAGFWSIITGLVIFATAVLITPIISYAPKILGFYKQKNISAKYIVYISSLIYFILIILAKVSADRYLLFLQLFFTIVFLDFVKNKKTILPVFIIGFVLLGFFSVAAAQDYMNWNRARWDGIHYLTEELGIQKTEIDGGFEFNGYYLRGNTNATKYWWVVDDKYVISFRPLEGYEVFKTIGYVTYLPVSDSKIYVLKRL